MSNAPAGSESSWTSPHGRALPEVGRRTLVLAVLNVTPDSFSDGGQLLSASALIERARSLLIGGADILDVGGESTRPGAQPVDEAEERARVLPAIATLRTAFPDVPISIDTTKPAIARDAVRAGADLINDTQGCTAGLSPPERSAWISALRLGRQAAAHPGTPAPKRPASSSPPSPLPVSAPSSTASPASAVPLSVLPPLPPDRSGMARAVADLRCPVILMHNRPDLDYGDFWEDVLDDLRLSLALVRDAGVPDRQVWVDPGFGFAKEPRHNLEVLRNLGKLTQLGRPILLGTSRKSTLGRVLGTPVDDRLDATAATLVWGIQQGCSMVRIHDVAELARTIRMADAIRNGLHWKDLHG